MIPGRVLKAHVPSWIAEHPCYRNGTLDLAIRDHLSFTEAERAIQDKIVQKGSLDDLTKGEREELNLLRRWLKEGVIAEEAFKDFGYETRRRS